jgi:hypothetical protein
VDKQLEALIFNSLSDQKIGPKNIFSNDVYRIEEFIEGRPISIWEMRNPIIMKKVVEIIFEMNFNQNLRDSVEKILPCNPKKLAIDIAIEEWGPKVRDMLPSLRGKLL